MLSDKVGYLGPVLNLNIDTKPLNELADKTGYSGCQEISLAIMFVLRLDF